MAARRDQPVGTVKNALASPTQAERDRSARLSSMVGLIAQAIQVAMSLITVPLILHAFGPERYGIWMSVTSALAITSVADLGIGIGLQNGLARAFGLADTSLARTLVSTAFPVVGIMAALLAFASLTFVPLLPIHRLLGASPLIPIEELLPTVSVALVGYCLALVAGLSQRLYDAYQKGAAFRIILIVARSVSFAGVIWVTIGHHALEGLAWAVCVGPNAMLLLASVIFFTRHPEIAPSIKWIDGSALRSLATSGGVGILAVVAFSLQFGMSTAVVSNRLGAIEAAGFAVVMRIVGVFVSAAAAALLPLWPAYTEAFARKQHGWMLAAYAKGLYRSLGVYTILATLVVVIGPKGILLWTRSHAATPSRTVLAAGLVLGGLTIWNSSTSMLLNGIGRFRGQATYGVAIAGTTIGAAYLVPSQMGLSGLLAVFVAGMLLRCTVMSYEIRRERRTWGVTGGL